ncbi:MAG: hypothetical protein ABIJ33_04955 [Patescibacteria group bacterium]
MPTLKQLKAVAISAARCGNWQQALDINQQITELEPNNVNALNRIGVAYAQSKQTAKSVKAFKQVLAIDRHNLIAKKHLVKLNNHNCLSAPIFSKQQFIEEPGKTKVVELHRLAGKSVLQSLCVGSSCELVRKKRYISIEVNDQYVGALPEDLSFRLCRLITQGNEYGCLVRSVTDTSCSVYLQEIKRSKRNENIHSFPPGKFIAMMNDEIDENILIDDTPVTDVFKPDSEKSEDVQEEINPNVAAMP